MVTKLYPQIRYSSSEVHRVSGFDRSQIAFFIKQGLPFEVTHGGVFFRGEDLIRFIGQNKDVCTPQDLH